MDSEAEIKEAFKQFDKTNSGTVTTAELRHIMTNLGEKLTDEEAEELLKEADPNKKGTVNYSDFIRVMMAN